MEGECLRPWLLQAARKVKRERQSLGHSRPTPRLLCMHACRDLLGRVGLAALPPPQRVVRPPG